MVRGPERVHNCDEHNTKKKNREKKILNIHLKACETNMATRCAEILSMIVLWSLGQERGHNQETAPILQAIGKQIGHIWVFCKGGGLYFIIEGKM